MKKTSRLLLLAWSFVVSLILVACSSLDDAEGEVVEQGGVVKTEFTISFPQQMGGYTRQGLDIVQDNSIALDNRFRGMQHIKLRPFGTVAGSLDGNTAISTEISLKDAGGTVSNILASDALYATSLSHLYKDVEVPIGTRSFLFYGEAKDKEGSATTTMSQYSVNGTLNCLDTGSKLSDIEFNPQQIFTGSTNGEATGVAKYLSNIAKVTIGTESTLTYFPNFKDIKAGSWNSAKAVAQQVYYGLYTKTDDLSKAIIQALLIQNWGTTEAPQWKVFAKEGKDSENKLTGSLVFDNTNNAVVSEYSTTDYPDREYQTYTYPQNIGLPDGAAYILWSSAANEFQPVTTDNMGMNVSTLEKYVYPASLYYFGLSDIKTANASMQTYYNGTNDWPTILAGYDNAEGHSNVVQSTTRSVAIINKMQYGVGRLDVTVTTQSGTASLNDNNDKSVSITATTFPITGIVVGNQRAVDYQFEAKKNVTASTLYDGQVYNVAGTPNAFMYTGNDNQAVKTHTLVLETLDATTEGLQEADYNVPIAVEFLNNSNQSFVGMNNEIIYPNTKFYLVGTLTPATNTQYKYSEQDARHYRSGADNTIKKAFVQDYVTTANFVVANLKKAYNLLPDLRTPHLEIGMSVDLTWQTGISQTITIQ